MIKNSFLAIFLILSFISFAAFGFEDSLLKSIEVSSHGAKFQSERVKIAAENLANEDSLSSIPGGDPYRRKVVFAKNHYDRKLNTRVVKVKKYGHDKSSFKIKYDPYHPAADNNGYVKLPNVDKIIEKADADEAQRSFEADIGMIEVSKHMINKTMEVMR
jgi:flagellar basal-body rod protein FlgC